MSGLMSYLGEASSPSEPQNFSIDSPNNLGHHYHHPTYYMCSNEKMSPWVNTWLASLLKVQGFVVPTMNSSSQLSRRGFEYVLFIKSSTFPTLLDTIYVESHLNVCRSRRHNETEGWTGESRKQMRRRETRIVVHTKPQIFDGINKGKVEPRVSPNNLTLFTWSRAEILTLHRDILWLPTHCKLPLLKEIKAGGVISTKTIHMTSRLIRTSCKK